MINLKKTLIIIFVFAFAFNLPSCSVVTNRVQEEVAQPKSPAKLLTFEQRMGVHQSPSWMNVCGTDLYIGENPMSPGDTLLAYCQDKLVGARRITECPNLDSCSYNVLTYLAIYLNDPYDSISADCPEVGDTINFTYNSFPVISIPTVVWTQLGGATTLMGFEYDPFCCMHRGDLDDNGEIDISDLIFMINWMFTGGPFPVCFQNADVDDTGQVDISDLIYLISYMFEGGPAPVVCQ